jgi:hypothetical protein
MRACPHRADRTPLHPGRLALPSWPATDCAPYAAASGPKDNAGRQWKPLSQKANAPIALGLRHHLTHHLLDNFS